MTWLLCFFVVGFAAGWLTAIVFRFLVIARHQRCMMCDGHGYQTPSRIQEVLEQSQRFKP